MRDINKIGKFALAVCFLLIIGVMGTKSYPITAIGNIFKLIAQPFEKSGDKSMEEVSTKEAHITIDAVKTEYTDFMWLKSSFIDLNGTIARNLNMKGYYSSMGMYVTDEYYIVSQYAKTTTDWEYEQLLKLKDFLDEKNINLLYVNFPAKYVDDSFMAEEFGIESYSNRNADLFLGRIKDAGVNYVDLRDNIENENLNIYDMFYRTDHHWTTRTGLWATKIIAESMNEKCGYQIDTSIYDETNYSCTSYESSWIGEQGRKIAVSYLGLDDYELILPNFDTSFVVTTGRGTQEGEFDIMVDKTRFSSDADVYTTPSWHYGYMPTGIHNSTIHNNYMGQGKVLVLADSYSRVVVPFLSLGVSDVTTLVLRNFESDLTEYIEENDFDTVVVAYAQFMIGAHDNPASANYDMFTFE